MLSRLFGRAPASPVAHAPPAASPRDLPLGNRLYDGVLSTKSSKYAMYRNNYIPSTLNAQIKDLKRCPTTIILKEGTAGRVFISKELLTTHFDKFNSVFTKIFSKFTPIDTIVHGVLKADTPARVYINSEEAIEFIIDDLLMINPNNSSPIIFTVLHKTLVDSFPKIIGGKHGRKTRHKKRKSHRKSRRHRH